MEGENERVLRIAQWMGFALAGMVMAITLAGAEVAKGGGGSREQTLVFYMHDVPRGPHPTAVLVAGPTNQSLTLTSFGATTVFDDKITEGPDPGSREIGRAQGMYSLASSTDFNLLLAFTAVFRYPPRLDGSTLSFLGSDRIGLPSRDVPIVGGTGALRLARGVASISTVSVSLGVNVALKFHLTLTL